MVPVMVFLFPHALHSQQIKIVSVDMSKVFSEYYKTKKAEVELKDRATAYDKEIREHAAELKKMEEDGKKLQEDANNPALAEDKRREKQKAMESKLTEYRLLTQQLQDMAVSRKRELGEQQNRVRGTIVDEIVKVIQEKAKREGYTMVIDKSGLTLSGVSPFVYVVDSLDITEEIVKTLNANALVGGGGASGNEKSKGKK